jgi:hypothetical protein
MVGLIPLDDTWFWGLLIVCISVLILGFFIGGRGKAFRWLKVGSIFGVVILVMGGLVGPALVDFGTGNGDGDGVFTPLFTLSMAISADCNDLTGLDAVADCAVAGELNFRSEQKEMDVLFTIDQELVTILAPDENAVDFTIERYCEGDNDPVHCPMDSGVYLPAAVNVEVVSVASIHNQTIGDDVDIFETLASGTDIISWSDGTNVVLGKHKASPLQLEPGEEGTITFACEFDPSFFGATGIDDEMSLDSTKLSVAGQTVTINHIVVSYTA